MSENDGLYDDALLYFYDEAREMLQSVEDSLLSLATNPLDEEAVHALFRAAHTIKGTSGIFNLNRVVQFTHQVESVLDRVRKGGVSIDLQMSELLFASCDMISTLLQQAEDRCEVADELAATDQAAEKISNLLGTYLEPEKVPVSRKRPVEVKPKEDNQPDAIWHISLRFHVRTFTHGFDPVTVVTYLKTIGEIESIHVIDNSFPLWELFDPENCYLGFEIRLKTNVTKVKIESAFEFVADDCDVRIIPPTRRAADYIGLINELSNELRLGDILVSCGAVTREALDAALSQQEEMTDGKPKQVGQSIGEILVAQNQVATEVVDAALDRQSRMPAPNQNAAPGSRQESGLFVRVPADKLDELINLVGELVICGASASLQAVTAKDAALIVTTQQLSRLVEEIRNGALGLRMVRIGETFIRYRRVVHDVSTELGKTVNLTIDGADTELDKSVVEKIGDPLMHLVRNSLDHGLEMPEDRVAVGKPPEGTINLSARHDSGNIVIQVSDDGRGLNSEKLLTKGRERGLVAENQILTESEIFNLIFEPGFSTAEKVTNLSGRGVGMDVVRKNIEALRGSVKISSVLGQGTAIEIRLPLTLAIIDGFLVKIGTGAFVIPLHAVLECIDADPADMNLNEQSAGFIKLRGEVLPLLDLRSVFACKGRAPDKRRIVVVRGTGGAKAGLIVDELEGEYQTVIKPLGKLFRNLYGISGSTVLGSGEVALILDVPSLVKLASSSKNEGVFDRQKQLLRDLQAIGIEK